MSNPRVSERLTVLERDGLFLLVDPDAPAWAVVNKTGRAFTGFLDGRSTVPEIARRVAERFGIPYEPALSDTRDFIDELSRSDICWTGEREVAEPVIFQPVFRGIFLEITHACNLACRHCFASEGDECARREAGELSTTEILGVLDELAGLEGDHKVAVSGGEPLMRPDCLEILGHAKALGLNVELITNATLITPEVARTLSELAVNVQISLDGATAETNDRIRGRGTFERAMGGIRNLTEAGLSGRIALSMTPTALNLADIPALIDLALSLPVGRVHFSHLSRLGRAADNWEELALDPDDQIESMVLIREKAKELRETLSISGDHCDRLLEIANNLPKSPVVGCPLGSTVAIQPTGEAFPCPLLTSFPEFCLGDVRRGSLMEMVEGPALERARQTAAERVMRIAKCGACEWRHFCRGGCLGSALAHHGDGFAEDPRCGINHRLLEKLVFESAVGGEAT